MNYEIKTSLFQVMNETFQSLFGARLREERKALGLKQDQVAHLVGVTREHWGRCERGQAVPGGEVLAAFVRQGADVVYILTGQRSRPTPPMADLSPRVRALVRNYEATDEEGRRHIERAADLEAKSAATGRKQIARGGE